jgi:hypothetical protein
MQRRKINLERKKPQNKFATTSDPQNKFGTKKAFKK